MISNSGARLLFGAALLGLTLGLPGQSQAEEEPAQPTLGPRFGVVGQPAEQTQMAGRGSTYVYHPPQFSPRAAYYPDRTVVRSWLNVPRQVVVLPSPTVYAVAVPTTQGLMAYPAPVPARPVMVGGYGAYPNGVPITVGSGLW